MLQATEQQLQLVSRKVQRLEQSVHQEMESLRTIRTQRNEAVSYVQQLREQLTAAEERADILSREHEEIQSHLRQSAEEYAAAQLLQKKYLNTVSSLQGNCRAVVRLAGTHQINSRHATNDPVTIADDCTINAVERKKSFVFDAVFDEACQQRCDDE
jgi:chromosome segregation ATPase